MDTLQKQENHLKWGGVVAEQDAFDPKMGVFSVQVSGSCTVNAPGVIDTGDYTKLAYGKDCFKLEKLDSKNFFDKDAFDHIIAPFFADLGQPTTYANFVSDATRKKALEGLATRLLQYNTLGKVFGFCLAGGADDQSKHMLLLH